MDWKPDWPQAKANLTKWWNGKGLFIWVLNADKAAAEKLLRAVQQYRC